MRKILAGFMATSMIVAMASSVTFAASSASASFTTAAPAGAAAGDVYDRARLVMDPDGTGATEVILGEISVNIANDDAATATTKEDVAIGLDGKTFSNVEIGGKLYQIKLKANSAKTKLAATFSPAVKITGIDTTKAKFDIMVAKSGDDVFKTGMASPEKITNGTGDETADIEREGTLLDIKDVIVCDGEGNPVPLTEDPKGVDKDLNSDDGIQSGKTVYFMIKNGQYKFNDDAYWKLKISKGDNGKYIKAYSDVTKNFSGDLYNAVNGEKVGGTGGARYRYIKVELAEIFTDDEYKITLDLRLSAKDAAARVYKVDEDTEFKVSDFSFYMKNMVKDADNDWKVGIGGLMLNPLENDWNEVTYYDEDGDLAFMKFFADSDVSKFYAKLSTKWEHADYASYFNDQDAYIFDFTGSPKISATSRCDLEIYNPFVNDNGDETIDPATATIYQVIDGDLFDVTDSFEYKEGNNGDMAFSTRTRFLGTYIICEKPVEEAVDDSADVPTDLVPEDTTPNEVTPDNNNGGKAPANTGKYL